MRTRALLGGALVALIAASPDTSWAYHATVKIKVTNDSDTTYTVDVERSGGDSWKTIAGGDYYEWEYSATAYAWDETTYEYDVYVDDDDGDDAEACGTSIGVKTNWDFGVDLDQCTATTPQDSRCTVEIDKSGSTCMVSLTIND